jgi:hypothetical protein
MSPTSTFPRRGRSTATVLATLVLTGTAACGSASEVAPTRVDPGAAAVPAATQPHTRPCPHTADAASHWSARTDQPACVLTLRRTARRLEGITGDGSPQERAWVCPTTPDAAEAWVRSLGVAACRP